VLYAILKRGALLPIAPVPPMRPSACALAVLDRDIVNLAGGDPHDMDGVTDYVCGTLFAFWSSWRSYGLVLSGKLRKGGERLPMSKRSKLVLIWISVGPALLILSSYSRWLLIPLTALGIALNVSLYWGKNSN
jgi:hypothetical protein